MDSVVKLVDLADQRDEAYRAIGRYTVQFSALVAEMRQIMAPRIAGPEATERALIGLAFGSLTAQQVADPFFAMCREITHLDKGEQAIEKCLRGQVNAEIRERNVIAHGDWLIVRWTRPEFEAPPPTLVRVNAASVKEPFKYRDLTIEAIDGICERVEGLGLVVWEFGTVCARQGAYDPVLERPGRRVRDTLQLVDGRVVFRPGEHMAPFYAPH